jgi:hypothetical protein
MKSDLENDTSWKVSTSSGKRRQIRKRVTATTRTKMTINVPPMYMTGAMHSLADVESHSKANCHELASASRRTTVKDWVRVGGGVTVSVAVRV